MLKKDIELTKLIKDKEHFEKKIYYYQKKLSVPITVPVPKEEELPKETTLKNSPKQVKLTFTPLKISETDLTILHIIFKDSHFFVSLWYGNED